MSVNAWEDVLKLKTYLLGPADPNPPFQRPGARGVYPYPMLDDLTSRPEMVAYRALHLENDYLHLIVLPELGGHVYSLFDKVVRREVFYRNNVVKYGLVARRAAWISGGIEFNFPQRGHSHVTVSPVSARIIEDPEGWDTGIVIGATDRTSRMRWSVELRLPADGARLIQRVVLHNPTPVRHSHYFWSNSAMPATNDLRLVFPATEVKTSHGQHVYPHFYDTDLSLYRNHRVPNDIFCMNSAEDFFGCYYEDTDFGMVHCADNRLNFGKKFFTWGTADEGMIWVDLLTDDDGQYVELQAGRFVDQSVQEFLGPHQAVGWREIWYPVHGIGGFQFANYSAAINVEVSGAGAEIAAMVNMAMPPGRLVVDHDGHEVFNEEVALVPGQPLNARVALPKPIPENELSVALVCNGRELLRYTPGSIETHSRPIEATLQAPPEYEEESAEQLCTRAVKSELAADPGEAERLYRRALEIDPGLSSAHLGLAMVALAKGLASDAVKHLRQAVSRDRQNDEAWYYLALAQVMRAEYDEADDIFWWLAGRSKCRAEARIALARLAVRQGRSTDALHAAVPDVERSLDAAFIVAIDHRRLGIDTEELLAEQRRRYPLAAEFIAENVLLEASSENPDNAAEALEALLSVLGDEPEEWLELAHKYLECERIDDAVFLLRGGCESSAAVAEYPMIHYQLAYLLDGEERDREYKLGAVADPEYCFPSRVEELEVLERAAEHSATDWKARMYLGNLLASLGRHDEALRFWKAAAELYDNCSVLSRNLGLVCSLWREEHDEAIRWYDKAIVQRPEDYHLYIERDAALGRAGADAETRLEALTAGPDEVTDRWQIAALRIGHLLDLEQWNQALEHLGAHDFLPWEGARMMHAYWTRALVGRAAVARKQGNPSAALADYQLALTYPRNLGVGRAAYPQEAMVHWLIAELGEELGDEGMRDNHLQAAATEQHSRMCEADIFKARALAALGKENEAEDLLAALTEWAEATTDDSRDYEQAQRVLALLAE